MKKILFMLIFTLGIIGAFAAGINIGFHSGITASNIAILSVGGSPGFCVEMNCIAMEVKQASIKSHLNL